ncbi:lyase family protein [Solicola sp. PLA-1-18]|uniref:lyase family protein n=1 Tax=Solicola sp. PLA-1-18 TaxID=3380532 RepID=UPI003B817C5B
MTDADLVARMLGVEVALLRALERTLDAPAGVADGLAAVPWVDAALRGQVGTAGYDPGELTAEAAVDGNLVIPMVRRVRAEATGDVAAWFHHGATSQDVLDTALVLLARDVLADVAGSLTDLGRSLARLADEHRRTPMVARTLTQQAQPTTFGFKAAGWLAGVTDALVRVQQVRTSLPVSLGGPVGTTAAFGVRGPEVVAALAEQLGLAEPTLAWHTRRTPVLDVGHALVVTAGAVGTIAADVLVMAQTEIGELQEGVGGPSSSMPHKRNPAASVLVVAAARQVPALVSILGVSAVAENERPAGAWTAEWQPLRTALDVVRDAADRTAHLVDGLQVDQAAMAQHVRTLSMLIETDPDVSPSTDPWIDRTLAAWRAAPRNRRDA